MKRFVIAFLICCGFTHYSNAHQGVEKNNWQFEYCKKSNWIDYRYIDADYSSFYKIEFYDNAGEKTLIITNETEPGFISQEKNINRKAITLCKEEDIDVEIVYDIRDIKLSPKYCVFYQMQIYNKQGEKRLIILCKEREAAKDLEPLKKCNSKNKKDKEKEGNKKDKNTKDKEKSSEKAEPSKKTKEELVQERDEHIRRGIIDVGIAGVGTAGSVAATGIGHVGLAVLEVSGAVYEINEAANEFKEAYECQKQISEIEEKSEDKNEN